MKIIVIVLGVLLLLGFLGVVGTIVYRVVNLADDQPQLRANETEYSISQSAERVAIGNIEVAKPNGSTLKSFNVEGGLVYLHFETSLGVESIKIVRLRDGLVVGSIGFENTQ